MAGFSGGNGDAHGFWVAHFAYDDDVWSLAQSGAQAVEIRSVGADFDLFDDAADVAMLVLDGIFDDDNVAGFAMIDFVDERGHGGGLPELRRATEEPGRGKFGKIFTVGGRWSSLSEGTLFGNARMAAAARERSRWRLMRKRPSPSMR
jgi:hypothetical protein